MFLSESGNGGDGLLRSDNATLDSSMTVRFIDHTPGQRMEFDRGADRVRPLLPGQGGAAWIRYRSMRPNASDPVVLVLWEAPNRAKGMRPKVLRGARADQWIRHISTADAPVPTPLLSRIWTAVTPGWLADPQIRPAVNVVSAVFGAVLLLVAALVAMDLSGLRSVLPLTVEYDWLGFAGGLMGGVAGGVMTLAGVMLTLRSSGRAERQRQQDESMRTRLSVMPLLDLALSDDAAHFDNSRGQLAGRGWLIFPLGGRIETRPQDSVDHTLAIICHNIGLGHARLRYVSVDRRDDFGAVSRLGDFGEPNGILQVGHQHVIRMSLAQSREPAAGKDKPDENFMLVLTIYYEDLLGNRYRQRLDASLFSPLPSPSSTETPAPVVHSFQGAIKPPEFVGAPDGNLFWYH